MCSFSNQAALECCDERTRNTVVGALGRASLAWTAAAIAQPRAIDTEKSAMVVRVYKAGVFSVLGHDHEIAAPIAGGSVDIAARQVDLQTKASALKVRDPHVSDKDVAEMQTTMLGPKSSRLNTTRKSFFGPQAPSQWALLPGR